MLMLALSTAVSADQVKIVKRRNETTRKRLVDKKAVEIEEGTSVLQTEVNGYIRFTAPEKGTYQITFSDVYPITMYGTECQYAFMLPFKVSGKKLKQVKMKVSGAKVKEIWLASQ